MIGIRLQGGLGNMLFQIATGEYWRSLGHNVVYTDMDDNLKYIAKNYTPHRNSDVYKSLFPNFDWDAHRALDNHGLKRYNVPFIYTDIEPKDGIEYVGYFQSEKFFPNRELIRGIFQFNANIQSTAMSVLSPLAKTCSIHVRRQDYLKLADYHTVLTKDYYAKAIATLSPFKIDQYLVFSDDVQWCKDNFTGGNFLFVESTEYLALCMMSLCNHNIIANSSLSWWGAWLGEKLDRVIIAPVDWFGIKGQDPKDIIPLTWIKL